MKSSLYQSKMGEISATLVIDGRSSSDWQPAVFSIASCNHSLDWALPLLSLGDVVAINALLLQLSRPMDFIGYTVSEVRQSLADMDAMARLLLLPDTPTAVRPSVGPADAPPSDVNSLPRPCGAAASTSVTSLRPGTTLRYSRDVDGKVTRRVVRERTEPTFFVEKSSSGEISFTALRMPASSRAVTCSTPCCPAACPGSSPSSRSSEQP